MISFTSKSKKSIEQRVAERKKAEDDPLNYVRRDAPIRNPFDYLALLKAYYNPANSLPYKKLRELVSESQRGIPTTESLEKMKEDFNQGILSEAERQFRYSSPKPVKPGYEFQIL